MAKIRHVKKVDRKVKIECFNAKKRLRSLSKDNHVYTWDVDQARGKSSKFELVVLLKKSEIVESLIQNLKKEDRMMLDSVKRHAPKPKIHPPLKSETPRDRLQLGSFKITTQLKSQTRKIDILPIPLETVSMKLNETQPQTVRKRPLWTPSDNLTVATLDGIFNVTSSNVLFKSASLEADTSPVSLPSSKKSLSRASSICSLNSIPSIPHCSSANITVNISPTHRKIVINRCKTPNDTSPKAEEYDSSSRETPLVRSESSGYYSEYKLSDVSQASSAMSSPKRVADNNSSYCQSLPTCSPQNKSYAQTAQTNPPSRSAQDRSPVRMVQINFPSSSTQNRTPLQTAQNNPGASVPKRKYDFKTPKLPLCKRPPTRIKAEQLSSNARSWISNANESLQDQEEIDNSDVLSLYAESISDIEKPVPRKNVIKVIQAPGLKPNATSPVPSPINNTKNSSIANNENSRTPIISGPLTTETLSTAYNAVETHTSKVDQWIASAPSAKDQVNFHVFVNSLKKLCFFHYAKGKCWKKGCGFSHSLPNNFQNYLSVNLRDLNENQLKVVLSEIVRRSYLFIEIFDVLLLSFKERDAPDDLIYIIQDILNLKVDKTPFIRKVISTLMDLGYSFVEAVEEILLTHGRKTESLLDILLMFIVEENGCLENNWHFIDKLTKFRKNKLDYGVVSEIFQKCCGETSPNKEFCENIYKDLIIKNHIELDKIDRDLVIKYVNLLYHFNLNGYAEQLMQYNRIGEHEVVKAVIPEVHEDSVDRADVSESNQTSSTSSSCPTTPSSSSGSSRSNSDEKECPESGERAEIANCADEPEEMLDFSFEASDVANDECIEEEEREVEGVAVKEEFTKERAVASEASSDLKCAIPVQLNYDYTNNDLDTYLNFVNMNTYTSNYYRSDDVVSAKSTSISAYDSANCAAPLPIERSTPVQGKDVAKDPPSPTRSIPEMELSDESIMTLMTTFNNQDLCGIFTIMKKYADNNMSRSFLVHTITTLKNMPSLKFCKLIVDIFDNLEILHSVNQSSPMRSLVKSLAFNVLPILDKRKEYGTVTRILNIYSKELDSFLETKCVSHYELLATKKMRYIFIFKIYVRDRKLKEALKLLKSNLDLFQDMATDTNAQQVDYKKRILNEFLETALQRDLQVARESILYLMLNMESLKQMINLERYLNQLIVKLLNCYSTYKMDLIGLWDNIVNGWCRYLQPSVMRGIFIQTYFDRPERKLIDFFNLCVERQIYTIHEGLGNSINIPKNLVAEEIQYMLHIQFYKMCRANFPLENIIITTEQCMESDEYTNQINVLRNSVVDSEEMIRRIQNVFSKFENFPSGRDKINTETPGIIMFCYKDARCFFSPYRTGLPSIMKYR